MGGLALVGSDVRKSTTRITKVMDNLLDTDILHFMPQRFLFLFFALLASLSTLCTAFQQSNDLGALDGEWIYVEDRTEGRAHEQLGPPMGSRFLFKVDEGAVILVWGHGGGGNRDVRRARRLSLSAILRLSKFSSDSVSPSSKEAN